MAKSLSSPGFESAKQLVRRLLRTQGDGDDYSESYALREIVGELETALPKDHLLDGDSDLSALHASACLVQYLWESQALDYKQDLRKCPLLTAAGKIAHLAVSEQILSPVVRWPASAQPYAKLYTERRLLSDRYSEDDVLRNALDPLVAAGVVVTAPVYRAERSEIDDVNLLRAMSSAPSDMVGVAVRNEPFGQIAFLSTDLVQRCGQDAELAALLLEFVLSVAAKEDQSWREVNEVTALRAGEPVALPLRRATWPFELKVRSWVPVRIPDEDSFQPMPANESNLREILDTTWLRDNRDGVDLLHEVFGFRQLTLLIDSLGSNMEAELITLLQDPELLKSAVSSPEAVKFASELAVGGVDFNSVRVIVEDLQSDENLVKHLDERREQRRRVHENQRLGCRVEDLVRESLQGTGFSVRRTGVGSDFEISADTGDVANLELKLGDRRWLMEVKSTRDERVRMTDVQARTAVSEGSAFLLCVVPLPDGTVTPQPGEVEAAMRFVQGIGPRLEHVCDDLGEFRDRREAITAEEANGVQLEITPGPVRVRIASSVWNSHGFPLPELVERLVAGG